MQYRLYPKILVMIGLLMCSLVATAVFAQGHPCDNAVANNPTIVVTGPVSVGFCHSGKDALNNPTTITSFRLQLDGADLFTGPLTAIGAPSTVSGQSYYETPKTLVISRGAHSAVVYASNADGEGPASIPFGFTIKVPPGQGKVQSVNK